MCKHHFVLSEEDKAAVLLQLSKVGHKKPKKWKLLHTEICEDKHDFNNMRALKHYSEKHNFAVNVVSNPNEASSLDKGVIRIRFRYVVHPKAKKRQKIISNTREFCRTLITQNKLYRKEDINRMSFSGANPDFKTNYSIFKYKGSYGCRHAWQREVYLIERDAAETENNRIIEKEDLTSPEDANNKSLKMSKESKSILQMAKELFADKKISKKEALELTEEVAKNVDTSFKDLQVGDKTLRVDGEAMEIGAAVSWIDENGEAMPVEDGEIEVSIDEVPTILKIEGGLIADIMSKVDEVEEEAEDKFNAEKSYNELLNTVNEIKKALDQPNEFKSQLDAAKEEIKKEVAQAFSELPALEGREVKKEIKKEKSLSKFEELKRRISK